MSTLPRRLSAAVAATVAIGAFSAANSPDASAAGTNAWTLHYKASAATYISGMGKSVTATGTTTSVFDFNSRALSSDLRLNPVTASALNIGKLDLAYATVAVEPSGKATGKVAMDGTITQTQYAYFHITKLTGPAKLVNLVGGSCRTSQPAKIVTTGKMGGLFDPVTLKGTFSIPKFSGCGAFGALNPIIDQKMAGAGNTITLTLTPTAG